MKIMSDSLQCTVLIMTTLPRDSLVSLTIFIILHCLLILLINVTSEIIDQKNFAQFLHIDYDLKAEA